MAIKKLRSSSRPVSRKRKAPLVYRGAAVRGPSTKMNRGRRPQTIARSVHRSTPSKNDKVYAAYRQILLKRGIPISMQQAKNVPYRLALSTVQKAMRERKPSVSGSAAKTRQRPLRRAGNKQAGLMRGPRRSNRIMTKTRKRRTAWTRRTLAFPAPPTVPEVTPIPTAPILPAIEADVINAPAPLSEEIHSQSIDTQRIESIFYQNREQLFDPGLWSMVVSDLPSDYQIPDPAFTSSLSQAHKQLNG